MTSAKRAAARTLSRAREWVAEHADAIRAVGRWYLSPKVGNLRARTDAGLTCCPLSAAVRPRPMGSMNPVPLALRLGLSKGVATLIARAADNGLAPDARIVRADLIAALDPGPAPDAAR